MESEKNQSEKMDTSVDSGAPVEWKKYESYHVKVDPNQDDKATELKLCNFSRPHMRAFHVCWWSFFIAFFIWFAIAPLQSEIKKTLGLTKQELWTASIVGVSGTIFMRFLLGPLCDKYGGRALMAVVLCVASIPTGCTGLIQSASGLAWLRLFIGIAGGTFVMCQFWMSKMFAKEIVGTANGIAAGWGNLGGGVTQLVMGSVLFPLFKDVFFDGNAEKAWRTVCIVPAVVGFASGILCYVIADDLPKGQYADLKKHGNMVEASAAASFRRGALNFNTWILFLQYAACFGVELTMNNAASLYFTEEFGQTTEKAAAIASIFGWMNLFARGLGGYTSDKLNSGMGMRGRLIAQTVFLVGEGAMILIFANTKSMTGAIFVMVIFSLFVQAAEGSTFGVVPYVDAPATGAISGVVGAGGNIGAVGFGLCFRQLAYKDAFMIMGWIVLASGFTSACVSIKGHRTLLGGSDQEEQAPQQTLTVPEKELKDSEDDDDEDDKKLEA